MSNFPAEISTGFTLVWNKRQRRLKGKEMETAPEPLREITFKIELHGQVVTIRVRIRRVPGSVSDQLPD